MIPTLLGALSSGFTQVTVTLVPGGDSIAIPSGANTVDIYYVTTGQAGIAGTSGVSGGNGGAGGDCRWQTGITFGAHTVIQTAAGSLFWEDFSAITLAHSNAGGAGGAGSSSAAQGYLGGGGGGPATELTVGAPGVSAAGGGAGGRTSTTGSLLASHLGHGGDAGGTIGGDGTAWGGGGAGGPGTASLQNGNQDFGGVLLIFK